MNRIVVIRGGAIGDFVLTLPAIDLLREAWPQARLEILGYPHIVALAKNRFHAETVRSIEAGPLARFFARDAELPGDWVGYFAKFDLIVSYLFDPDGVFEENVCRCAVGDFLSCFRQIDGGEHAAKQWARPLERLGLVLNDCAARLYPAEADRIFARNFLPGEGTIALHPGSGSRTKNWPSENWIALLERLLRERPESSLLVVGGEADESQVAELRGVFRGRIGFAMNLSLVELAAVLERCAFFVGHDSGVSHIAAAVGTQCLLLFGPSDPAVWAPANNNVRVLRAPGGKMADLPTNEVFASLLIEGPLTS